MPVLINFGFVYWNFDFGARFLIEFFNGFLTDFGKVIWSF